MSLAALEEWVATELDDEQRALFSDAIDEMGYEDFKEAVIAELAPNSEEELCIAHPEDYELAPVVSLWDSMKDDLTSASFLTRMALTIGVIIAGIYYF